MTATLQNYPAVHASRDLYFEIVCPNKYLTATLDSKIPYIRVDLLSRVTFPLPRISLTPDGCFDVSDFQVVDDKSKTPEYVEFKMSSSKMDFDSIGDSMEIYIEDSELSGKEVKLTLIAIANDSKKS